MKAQPRKYPPPIRRRDPSITPPLSFAQQRLWFLQQLQPENTAYNIPLAVRWCGPLDLKVLDQSVSEVLRRHESLRTTLKEIDGQPVQVISPATSISLPVVDLSELPEEARASEVARYRQKEVQTSFNLAEGPLWRAKLLRFGPEEHVVVFTLHHTIADGWSLNLLKREVGQLYQAFAAGGPSPLEELPVQYADFAIWQREWLQGDVLNAQLNYWRKELMGAPTRLELPTDRPHTEKDKGVGAIHCFTIPREVVAKLKEIGRREEATLFMVLLAGYAALLSRYSGQDEILIGTAIAGRQRLELEKLIGVFINTLVIRANLSGNPSFRELVRRVRAVVLGAYAHQDVPLEKLVEELQPERSASQSPLFQTLMVMHNLPYEAAALEGQQVNWFEVEEVSAKFDLKLAVGEVGPEVQGSFVYSTDVFDSSTIGWMAERYQALLREAAQGRQLTFSDSKSREFATAFNAPLE